MSQMLIIAKDVAMRGQLQQLARESGIAVDTTDDLAAGLKEIERDPPIVVVAENPADDESMENLHNTMNRHAPVTPLLVFIPQRDSALALKRMNQGAYDCLCPPLTPGDFLAAAKRAVLRTGRRLLTSRRVRPWVWWKQPVFFAAVGVVAVIGLAAVGMMRLWEPTYRVYKLATDHPVSVAGDKENIWVVDWSQQTLTAVRASGNYLSIVQMKKIEDFQPAAIAFAPYYAYTASADGRLRRHRADESFSVVAMVPGPGPAPSGLAWDGESLWSCDSYTGKIYEYDARLNVKSSFLAPSAKPSAIAWHNKALWVADGENNVLWKLTRQGMDWKKAGPYQLSIFAKNKNYQLSGFTIWNDRVWFVSEAGGVLVKHNLPGGD